MANERVSQLIQLLESEIQPNDVFLVTDTSQKESKQLQMGDVVTYVQTNGTFNAVNASFASTASYIKASNIDGLEVSNIVASQSISSSYSAYSLSSSHSNISDTASFASFSVQSMVSAQTASYLYYDGVDFNGTSSYAVNAGTSNISTQSLNLYYDGINPNGTSSYAVNAGTSEFSISSSYSPQSDNATNASYSLLTLFSSASLSSSWTSQSLSSSYSLSSSVAFLGITASYINVKSGFGFVDGTVLSSSVANSSSYSKTASYSLNTSPALTTIVGHTWHIVNPRAAFANGNNLYVISQNATSTASIFQINRNTNAVSPISAINSAYFTNNETYFWGRIFISNYDNVSPVAVINTKTGLYNYNLNTNVLTSYRSSLTVNSGAYIQNDLPIQADFSISLGNLFGNTWPSYYCLHGSAAGNDVNGGGQFPKLTLYQLLHSNSVASSGSYVRNNIATIDISKVNNSSSFLQYYNNTTSSVYNTLLWDYNPILKNFYLIDVSTGFLSIFSQSTTITNSTFSPLSMSYVATYAVTLPHGEPWSNANTDRFIVDYNINSGTENGLILVKAGNASYGGTVSYIPWPVNGN